MVNLKSVQVSSVRGSGLNRGESVDESGFAFWSLAARMVDERGDKNLENWEVHD